MNRIKEPDRNRFLKRLNPLWTPNDVVLFAVVDGYEDKSQALIPPPIINKGIIYMECGQRGTEANQQVARYGSVDWGTKSMPGYGLGTDVQLAPTVG
jgi:hypothetical protein